MKVRELMKSFRRSSVAAVFVAFAMVACSAEQGDVGAIGPAGPAGPAGADGAAGAPGAAGANGANGSNGTNGTNGADGVDGVDGVDGERGPGYNTLRFEHIGLPQTTAERNAILASSKVWVNGEEHDLQFQELLEVGQQYGDHVWGLLTDKDGNPILESDGSSQISSNPDFSSLLKVGDKMFTVTHFENGPGGMYLTELGMEADGTFSVVGTQPVDWSEWGGLWVPCAGSVTPWETHLGSEEYPMDAKSFEGYTKLTDMGGWHRPHLRYHGFDIYNPADDAAEWAQVKAVWSPYLFGYATEVAVAANGTYTAEKHYALGRQSFELSYVMPDQKTVYSTDDGTNVILTMFVADAAGDLSAGTLYAARFYQTSNVGAGAADVEWISLGHATHAEVKAFIDAGIEFSQIFTEAEPLVDADGVQTGECPDTFRAINTSSGFECLSLVAGQDIAASRLETRRYAAYMGATTELRKEEGLAFDPVSGTLFVAISEIERGMEDFKRSGSEDLRYDIGGGNHLKLEHNDCGAVYAMDIEADSVIGSDYVARNWYGIIEGYEVEYDADSAYAGNVCSVTGIANPDNLTFIPGYNTLIIGEDTSKHENNVIWAYDMVTGEMTRIMTVHDEAETTSPYWYPNIGGHSFMTAVSQHAFDSTGFFGILGPFPNMSIEVE